MTINELLLWLSARRSGSWYQFRGAVERLEIEESEESGEDGAVLALHQRIKLNLERLAHVEFGTEENEKSWRVVPPSLAIMERRDRAIGVLCGARTPELVRRIEEKCQGLTLERLSSPDCPDVLRIAAANSAALLGVADGAGVLHQEDAPASLLAAAGSADFLASGHHEAMPSAGRDWDVQEFVIDGRRMRWRPSTLDEVNASASEGLFCFIRFETPVYYLRENGATFRVPGAVGKYWIASRSRRRFLRFNRQSRSLTLPAIMRPPLLTERALVLCSGTLPSVTRAFNRLILTYCDVPEEIAGMAAEVLGQDLK